MKREQVGNAQRNLPRQKAFRSFSGGFWRLFKSFFFRLFVVSKKSSKSALWEIAQSFQTDTRAVVSQKKKTSLFYIIFTNSIALSVEHTK